MNNVYILLFFLTVFSSSLTLYFEIYIAYNGQWFQVTFDLHTCALISNAT